MSQPLVPTPDDEVPRRALSVPRPWKSDSGLSVCLRRKSRRRGPSSTLRLIQTVYAG